MLWPLAFATARSGMPSRLKSAVVSAKGPRPTGISAARMNAVPPLAEQNGDAVSGDIGVGQIEPAVAIEVADDDDARAPGV